MRRLCGGLIALVVGGIAGCGYEVDEDRPATSRAPDDARACLRSDGFQTRARRFPGDRPGQPKDVLLANTNGSQAEIGFYASADRAKEREPDVRANADRANNDVDSGGAALIVYLTHPTDDVRERIRSCVFG